RRAARAIPSAAPPNGGGEARRVTSSLGTMQIDRHSLVQRFGLSVKQLEVVDGVVRGLTNREIGSEMQISTESVRTHLGVAMKKVGVRNRTALASAAVEASFDSVRAASALVV
ncbi:MAG TPA: helix-turn-helix transcriptional regulator, partial [Thermoanaerobaculia bacterium]|nr:helix-turn-helix transcriptional regulator [Thermoanaerobaculia bacterium]